MVRTALIGVALFLAASVAQAQNMGGAVGFNNVTNSICGGSCERARQRQDRFVDVRTLNALIANPPKANTRARSRDFTYKYKAQRTPSNLQTFVESAPNAQVRTELQSFLSTQPNLMPQIRQGIAQYGFDADNVADSYALWWINSWLVANKRDEDPDKGTVTMVKQQVYNAFAATPGFAQHGDTARQEYAEILMLQPALLSAAFDQVKGDPEMLDQVANTVRQGAKQIGMDFTTMDLTRNGFVPRQGADASGAMSEPEKVPVRNASVEGEDEDSMGLALAAGAGLVIVLVGGVAFLRRS